MKDLLETIIILSIIYIKIAIDMAGESPNLCLSLSLLIF
jgi:hypothetical protein